MENTDKLDNITQKLINEVNFTVKALDTKHKELSQTLTETIQKLKETTQDFDKAIQTQQEQYNLLKNEIGVMTLIPEKINDNINEIIPKISKEIAEIYEYNISEIHEKFNKLKNDLTEEAKSYTYTLQGLADKNIKEAMVISSRNKKNILCGLAAIIMFSAIVSGITSYLVTTKFPRFVEVKGTRDLTIYKSNVNILGTKSVAKDNS